MRVLQSMIFSHDTGSYKDEMFFRGRAIFTRSENKLIISKGQAIKFDTFYNAIQIRLWKHDCEIEKLWFSIKGKGTIVVKFGILRKAKNIIWVGSETIQLTEQSVNVEVVEWKNLFDGLLFVELVPLEDGYIYSGGFVTSQTPKNKVRLGVVITHFNRQKQVINSVNKLSTGILNQPGFENISLVVVDNSQNLDLDDERVVVIKNKNTGGSGGFARGLMHLKDNGFTHCLFMDDDASCLSESIKRTCTFFQYYSGTEKIGLAGILLRLDEANIIHESGAVWRKGGVEPIGCGYDVLREEDLLNLDWQYKQGDYGAWCYFAFEIKSVNSWPYPFFVRGDDVLFSLQNKFKILKIFGVATCIDDFCNKDSPMTTYLNLRYALMISAYKDSYGAFRWWRQYSTINNELVFGYLYSWGYAAEIALDQFLRSEFPSRDVDGSGFRLKLDNIKKTEIIESYDGSAPLISPRKQRMRGCRRVFRKLSMWKGVVIPQKLLKNTVWCMKSQSGKSEQARCRKSIKYYNDDNDTTIIAIHDKVELFKGWIRGWKYLFKIMTNFSRAKISAKEDIISSTSEEFWREVFK